MSPQQQFLALSKKYKTPKQVQAFIKTLAYNGEKGGETCRSAAGVYEHKMAHCLEASFLAAAILEHHGYPPLVVSFQSIDDLDHVLFVFKEKTGWGAISRSRDAGLNGREPIFRSIRDLTWSYYDYYVDGAGKIKGYQLANLDDTHTDWRASKTNVWKAEKYLVELKHKKLHSSLKRYKKLLRNFHRFGHPKLKKYCW